MTRIAINGLGRIGRTFMKLALENPALEIVAANDISDPDSLAYLINYDSVYGKYHGSVRVEHVSDGYGCRSARIACDSSLSGIRRLFRGRPWTFRSSSKPVARLRRTLTPDAILMPAPRTLCSRRQRRTTMPMMRVPC